MVFLSLYWGKGKVVPVVKHYAMKTYGGVDVWIHVFMTSAQIGGEWSASRPIAGLGDVERRNPAPTGTRTPTPQPSSP
jgi:hypothetical protein